MRTFSWSTLTDHEHNDYTNWGSSFQTRANKHLLYKEVVVQNGTSVINTPGWDPKLSSPSERRTLGISGLLPSQPWLFSSPRHFQYFSGKTARQAACILLHLIRPEFHRAHVPSPAAPRQPQGERTFSESLCIALLTPLQFAFHISPSVALGWLFSTPPCPTLSHQAWVSDYFTQMEPFAFFQMKLRCISHFNF